MRQARAAHSTVNPSFCRWDRTLHPTYASTRVAAAWVVACPDSAVERWAVERWAVERWAVEVRSVDMMCGGFGFSRKTNGVTFISSNILDKIYIMWHFYALPLIARSNMSCRPSPRTSFAVWLPSLSLFFSSVERSLHILRYLANYSAPRRQSHAASRISDRSIPAMGWTRLRCRLKKALPFSAPGIIACDH